MDKAYSKRELGNGTFQAIEAFSHLAENGPLVQLNDPRLSRVVRLRLSADDGDPEYRVLYCHGKLRDGKACRVEIPPVSFPRGSVELRSALVRMANKAGVQAISLDLFAALST